MSKHNNFFINPILSRAKNYEALILIFLLFFLTGPYFFWKWYGSLFVNILVTTIALIFIWRNTDKLKGKQKSIFSFYVVVWLLYLVNEFVKGARLGVVAYLPYLLLGLVPFVRKDFGRSVYNRFVALYAILIGLSMISWVLAVTGIIPPIGEIGADNESMEAQRKAYLVYPLSLIKIGVIEDVTRFCGIFDEAGVVGTLSGLMLCGLRYNMKDWRAVVILISGLFSTSMFFYGLTAVYWSLELLLVRKRYGVMILLIGGVFISYQMTKENVVISHLVWDRFEYDSKDGFKGNTREGEKTTSVVRRMSATGEIWFGVKDKEAYWDEMFGTASIYNVFAMYGIIFTVLYIVWIIIVGYHYRLSRWDFFLYCFMVVGCLYQRPSVFDLPYLFLFVGAARYLEFQMDAVKPHRILRRQNANVSVNA